jgi:poly(hydroxyalkanoate) granule-associated protein
MGNKRKTSSEGGFEPYHIWLAGLGAAAQSEEEGSELFDELTARGREVVASSGKKARRKMQEVGTYLQSWVESTGKDVGGWFGRQVTGAARKAGLPSADDVGELTQRVSELARRLEELERARQGEPGPAQPAGDAARVEVHLRWGDDGWLVVAGDADKPESVHATKAAALAAARQLALERRPCLLIVHGRDGVVQSRRAVE